MFYTFTRMHRETVSVAVYNTVFIEGDWSQSRMLVAYDTKRKTCRPYMTFACG